MGRMKSVTATLTATFVVVSLIAGFVFVGTTVPEASAGGEVPDDAPDLTDEANFTVNLPFTTDHYPGDQNEGNGSIQYFASGDQAFHELDAEEGVWIDWIIIDAVSQGENWIDYSECTTDNTAAFGLDRGNNNSGTQVDEDLVSRQKSNDFRDDGITIEFFDFEDFAGDPLRMMPEDAIVAEQGANSAAGACLTMTDEPGWYQIEGFMNGTVADNGDDEPSDDAEEVELRLNSNWIYVCDCDSREEAEQQLGPAPDDPQEEPEDPPEDTPTPTPTPTEEPPEDDPTPTEEPPQDDPTPTPTEEPPQDDPTPTPTEQPPQDDTQPAQPQSDEGEPLVTPTVSDGPGFGVAVALVALLASGLLAQRRRG